MADPISAAISSVIVNSLAAAGVATTAATAAAITTTVTAVTTVAVTAALNAAATALLAPDVNKAGGNPTDWTLNPDAPIPFAFGRVGAAGTIVHRETFGADLMYEGFVTVLSGAGPINSFVSFSGDDQAVTFDGNGKANTSQWTNEMWMKTQTGLQPTTSAMTSPTGLKNSVTLPNWGSAYKLSGKAAYMLVLQENSKRSAYPTGEPKPLWVIQGLKVWDPRLDSTYPGGSGSCRLNTPSTWVYSTNGALFALKWALGLWEGPTGQGAPGVDYQVGGIGAPVSGIDVAAFVSAANIADANSWTAAAYPTTDDDKAQVLDGFLQTVGCIYAQKAGKISCIQRASPRTSIVTVSAADTAGPVEINTAASRINRINTIRARFWSENNRWQMTAIDEVTSSTYQTEDGGKRTRALDFPFVPGATQCAQLAALQIANTREGITGTIPLKPHLQRITPGDAFTITEPGFVLNGLKCLCLNTEYDPATGVHRVTFVSETDAKYSFALGQSPTAPSSPTLTATDPTYVAPPVSTDWTVTTRPATSGGGQIPGFRLAGSVSNSTATDVLVEWGTTSSGPWTQAYNGPATVENIPIDGVQPGTSYYLGVSYLRRQNISSRAVFGPYTAPAFVADDVSNTSAIATRVSATEARVQSQPNLLAYSNFAEGLKGWAALTGVNAGNAPENVGTYCLVIGAGNYTTSDFFPLNGNTQYSFSFEGDGGSNPSSATVYMQEWTNSGGAPGTQITDGLGQKSCVGGGWFTRLQSAAFTTSATARWGRVVVSAGASSLIAVSRIMVCNAAITPGWTDDATAKSVAARTSITETNVADAQSKLAIARLSLRAAATGGDPAYMEIVSSSYGSNIALVAQKIALAGSVGGTPVPVLEISAGRGRFTGNLDIDGSLVVTGSINGRNKIADRTVTNSVSAQTAAMVVLNRSTYTTLQSITITATGKKIWITAFVDADIFHPASPACSIDYRVIRGSTVILAKIIPVRGDSYTGTPVLVIEDTPAAGTYTYYIDAIVVSTVDATNADIANRLLRVEEKLTET